MLIFFRSWELGSNLVSPKNNHFHYIKNKIKREDKMTSSKSEKKILEIEFGTKNIFWVLFVIYFISITKSLFFENLYFRPDKSSQGHI